MRISYIGMQAEEVAIKPKLAVTLKSDAQLIDEVMVVAYGTAKKSAFTGSASVVSADEIGKIQTSNATDALKGKGSGVQLSTTSGQPGASNPTIRVRGISSINAGKDPLIILDGVPYDGDMNNISSQDIESMTVLKDAASNALYGARGANGVIMITTKKGNVGAAKVTVDAKWGANSRATQNYNTVSSPAQYYEMYYGALKNYFMDKQQLNESAAHAMVNQNMTSGNDYGLGYNVYTVPVGQNLIGTNGKLNPNATLGRVVDYKGNQYLLTPDDWMDATYRNSLRQEYNVSVSAGNDKGAFYTSFNYLKNDGITTNSDYERLTGRMKADYRVKPWLKVGANMSYTHFESNSLAEDGNSASSGNLFAIASNIAPIYPLYMRDGNGSIMFDTNGIMRYDYGDGQNGGGVRPFLGNSNALSSNILDTNNAEGNEINATGFFEVRFLKDFKFTSTNTVNVNEARYTNVTNPYYGQYATSNGIVTKEHQRIFAYNYQQLLTYQKDFGHHNVDVMVGHEAYRLKHYTLSGNKSNMFSPDNKELAGAVTDGSSNSYTTDYNTEGFFGRAQYNYDEKYFLSASYRRDASSRFHPDHRWGNFWSLGGAWLISKENWFNVDWVNELKVKASYGSQGNDDIGNYRYVSTYNIVNSSGNPAAVPATLGNKNITWETNGNFNAGIEFRVLDNRLSGSVEYFYRKTTDMLFSFSLPPSYGYSSYYKNIGDMRNSGVEAELSGTVIRTKDLQWDLKLNFTHYKNKVTYLPKETKLMEVDGVNGFSSSEYYFGEGIPLYTFRVKKYAGVNENGEALYYINKVAEDKTVTRETTTSYEDASNYLCGTALPDVYGGFGTSFSYKGVDVSIDFAYQIGGQCYDYDYASMMSSPTSNSKGTAFHADLLNAWTPENTASNIPRFQYGDQFTTSSSDRFLTSASYLSLQNINVGYTLPARICRTLGIEKVRFYAVCDNVWLWSKRQGLDPRQSITGQVTASYYAPIRTISGGVTFTF